MAMKFSSITQHCLEPKFCIQTARMCSRLYSDCEWLQLRTYHRESCHLPGYPMEFWQKMFSISTLPCHELSLSEPLNKITIFLLFLMSEWCQKEIISESLLVWLDISLSESSVRVTWGGRIHFDKCITPRSSSENNMIFISISAFSRYTTDLYTHITCLGRSHLGKSGIVGNVQRLHKKTEIPRRTKTRQ